MSGIRCRYGNFRAIARKLLDQGIPFIAMSGYAREQLPFIFFKVPFLTKPLQREKLLEELSRCIDRPSRPAHFRPTVVDETRFE